MFPRLDIMREFVSLHLGAREDEFTPVRGIAGAVVSGAVLLSALSLPLYALAAGDFGHTITSATAWSGCARSLSRFTIGTDDTSAMRTNVPWSKTRAATTAW